MNKNAFRFDLELLDEIKELLKPFMYYFGYANDPEKENMTAFFNYENPSEEDLKQLYGYKKLNEESMKYILEHKE